MKPWSPTLSAAEWHRLYGLAEAVTNEDGPFNSASEDFRKQVAIQVMLQVVIRICFPIASHD